MTPKISKYLCFAFSPALALFQWVVIKHQAYDVAALDIYKNTSQDALRNSNGSARDAQYYPNIFVRLHFAVWHNCDKLFSDRFSLFYSEKK